MRRLLSLCCGVVAVGCLTLSGVGAAFAQRVEIQPVLKQGPCIDGTRENAPDPGECTCTSQCPETGGATAVACQNVTTYGTCTHATCENESGSCERINTTCIKAKQRTCSGTCMLPHPDNQYCNASYCEDGGIANTPFTVLKCAG
jgi:hypothetical protein